MGAKMFDVTMLWFHRHLFSTLDATHQASWLSLTMDETQKHLYDAETKEQSKEWRYSGSSRP
jgi:hypothetical protein